MPGRRVYLDHHAATPLSASARDAIVAATAHVGNPSSVHGEGRALRRVIEQARAHLAAAVGARASSVVLTSGGTEACNAGVLGLGPVRRVVTTRIEHPAVARAVDVLVGRGAEVRFIEVAHDGTVGLDALDGIDAETLVACQWINHETGHVLPVAAIAARARTAGARCFVDATQALGKIPIDVGALGATAVAFASHKIGGPAGAGALVVEPGAALEPLVVGGSQEHGRRGGTQDALALAGFGAAALDVPTRLASMARVGALRDRLEQALLALGATPTVPATSPRAPTVTNVAFSMWRADWLVAALDAAGVACASGAACSSGVVARSPVIAALFPDAPERAACSLRVSLGPEVTEDDVAHAIDVFRDVIPRGA